MERIDFRHGKAYKRQEIPVEEAMLACLKAQRDEIAELKRRVELLERPRYYLNYTGSGTSSLTSSNHPTI